MDLNSISDEELQQELKRREEEKKRAEKPVMLENPDLTLLQKACQEYVDFVDSPDFHSDDYPHYIYEAAMEAFYGENFWDWYNKKCLNI